MDIRNPNTDKEAGLKALENLSNNQPRTHDCHYEIKSLLEAALSANDACSRLGLIGCVNCRKELLMSVMLQTAKAYKECQEKLLNMAISITDEMIQEIM